MSTEMVRSTLPAWVGRVATSPVDNENYLLAPRPVATEEEVNEILTIAEDSVRETVIAT